LVRIPPYYDQVYCKSCEEMSELPDDSVSLCVTSPPYWNAIDYDRHVEDSNLNYRTRSYAVGYEDYEEYLNWFGDICREILRVVKPGGFYGIVIGTVLLDGRHYPVPFDVISLLTRSGWEFHQDIIWHKVTGGVKRAGVFLQRPYPGYFYPNIMTEYILVLKKPGPPIYDVNRNKQDETSEVATERLFTNEIANSVWHIAPVPPGHLDHPCPFPEEIPERLIRLYSYPGDLVLDPFCGSGQTLKVSHHLGRHYVGYDINKEYIALSLTRIGTESGVRQKQLIATFEKIDFDAKRAGGKRKPDEHEYTLFPEDSTTEFGEGQ
jgi:DNA modification methylase